MLTSGVYFGYLKRFLLFVELANIHRHTSLIILAVQSSKKHRVNRYFHVRNTLLSSHLMSRNVKKLEIQTVLCFKSKADKISKPVCFVILCFMTLRAHRPRIGSAAKIVFYTIWQFLLRRVISWKGRENYCAFWFVYWLSTVYLQYGTSLSSSSFSRS